MSPKRFRAVVFDLDDTLYAEKQYVLSGCQAAAKYVYNLYGIGIYDELLKRFEAGQRGDLFTPTLRNYFKYVEPALIGRLQEVVACHRPAIELYPDACVCLARLNGMGMAAALLVTGPGRVQRQKVTALEVAPLLAAIVYADDLLAREPTADFWPDPFYVLELQAEIPLLETIYVGDNPQTDFLTPRRLGMGTARIMRREGEHALGTPPSREHTPDVTIPSLDMLPDVIEVIAAKRDDEAARALGPGDGSCRRSDAG